MMFNLCVGSGYGRCKIANLISSQGIQTRTGGNWHEATVGHILHNITYMGVLRSGESQSEVFPELQIIDPATFELAQKLMTERVNEFNEQRTLPRNTTGQSLLSGNVFCGHCGGRLTLTTNGKVCRQADGTCAKKKRIRYICYNKTRHRAECDGQTGYTMHILDDIIADILHQVFDKMKSATSDMIIGAAHQKQMALLQGDLKRAKAENTKANVEYESLKAEVLKAVQGKSSLPTDVLNELLDETRQRVLDTSRKVSELTTELENRNAKAAEMQAEFERIATWSEIFDSSDIATQKMICGYIIKKVTVRRNYQLSVKFNISVEQFLNGIDSMTQTGICELEMAE